MKTNYYTLQYLMHHYDKGRKEGEINLISIYYKGNKQFPLGMDLGDLYLYLLSSLNSC